jgi:hypothetical protein
VEQIIAVLRHHRGAQEEAEGDELRDRLGLSRGVGHDDDPLGCRHHAHSRDEKLPAQRDQRQPDGDLVLVHKRDHQADDHDLVRHGVHQLSEVRDEAALSGYVAVVPVARGSADEQDESKRRRPRPRAIHEPDDHEHQRDAG